jgi:hypothetical protein
MRVVQNHVKSCSLYVAVAIMTVNHQLLLVLRIIDMSVSDSAVCLQPLLLLLCVHMCFINNSTTLRARWEWVK